MKKWWIIALAVLTILSLAAGFFSSGEPGHWWNNVPGFFILFGLAGCILLILFSKKIGKLFLLKDEDYYDDK
jgi:asparagine N-glycosylation enzyme membrane subunit Stt3